MDNTKHTAVQDSTSEHKPVSDIAASESKIDASNIESGQSTIESVACKSKKVTIKSNNERLIVKDAKSSTTQEGSESVIKQPEAPPEDVSGLATDVLTHVDAKVRLSPLILF